ncbi:MAG: phage tail tape measure protein [bacterium]|nr:phage tail tape measure protein [bacterium]
MTRSVTLPLGAVGIAGIKMASDLETSFAKIENLVGMSGSLFDGFKGQIKELSSATATSQKELADALFVITSGGIRSAAAMDVLSKSAKMSQIGMGESAEIARGITGVMNSYEKSGMTAARASDVLMATIREGSVVAEDLAPTLGRATGMAAQMGISFEELGANIAVFTRLGVPAAEAITGLRGVMSAFIDPTLDAKKALADLDMTASDLRKMLGKDGLQATLEFLLTSWEGNEEALSGFFGNVRALSNALGTQGSQAEAYIVVLDSMRKALGIVDDGFNNVSKISGFKFKQMLIELQNVGIELGQAFIPVALKIVKVMRGVSQAFQSSSEEVKTLTRTVGLLLVALGPLASIIGGLATRFALLLSPVGLVVTAIAGLVFLMFKFKKEAGEFLLPVVNGFVLINNAVVGTVKYLKSLAQVMGAMQMGQWGLAASLAITELGADEGLKGMWETFKNSFTEGAGTLDFVNWWDVSGSLADFEKALKDGLSNIGQSLGLSSVGIGESFEKVERAIVSAKAQFSDMPERVINDFRWMQKGVETATDGVKESISSVQSTVERMNEAIKFAVVDGMVESFMLLGEALTSTNFDPRRFGEAILVTFITIAEQLGRLAILHGIAIEAIFESFKLGGTGAIIAGGMLLVAAGIAKSRLASIRDNNLPALAEGGLAFGPTLALVGDNRNASIDPEVVAPLSKLKAMMEGTGSKNVIVTGRLSGADLLISNERAGRQRSRYRGF